MTLTTIAAHYGHDHDRLDRLFGEYRSLKSSDAPRSRACFAEFKAGLERHIGWEEDLLFPLFEEKTGLRDGPTAVMRHEHRQIKRHLDAIDAALQAGKTGPDPEDDALLEILAAHNWKEEQILYPAIDRAVTEDERRRTFETMGAHGGGPDR